MKATDKEYKKLLKKYEPKKIINMHIMGTIDLRSKQIDELIALKNKVVEK
ncbi:hypothetical protein IKS57_02770 [bacterium]|nr:hypothetical protein [bacterium]